jgi:hypothetical protein
MEDLHPDGQTPGPFQSCGHLQPLKKTRVLGLALWFRPDNR